MSRQTCWWCGDPFTRPGEARPTKPVFRRLATWIPGQKRVLVMICATCAPRFDAAPRGPDDQGNGRPAGV